MDPLTGVMLAAAVGATTSKSIERAYEMLARWLRERYGTHDERVQLAAQANSIHFLADLHRRVAQLERNEGVKERIAKSLDRPDVSLLLKESLLGAAVTEDRGKHELLARLVAERLTANPDSLVALTSRTACGAIPHLNQNHLVILGLATLIRQIRPCLSGDGSPAEAQTQTVLWWTKSAESLLVQPVSITNMDLQHLAGLSCLQYSVLAFSLEKVLAKPGSPSSDWPKSFLETPVGQQVVELWKKGLDRVFLTSVGNLIGTYVFDRMTETTTVIDW